jgi:hypothetical protein
MLKYQTTTEYRNMLRDLSTADLLTLSESHVNNRVYQELIDAEVERRIANWEVVRQYESNANQSRNFNWHIQQF